MLQFAVAYFVMLLAMYFNGYVIICIFIGAFLGAFLFSWEPLVAGRQFGYVLFLFFFFFLLLVLLLLLLLFFFLLFFFLAFGYCYWILVAYANELEMIPWLRPSAVDDALHRK